MRLLTVIPYLNVMQMLAPRISADAGIRSWEMVEESKPTCQEEPLPCHRFPPSAQMHDTLLRCSARTKLCPCSALQSIVRPGGCLLPAKTSRPNASIHHPRPFPDCWSSSPSHHDKYLRIFRIFFRFDWFFKVQSSTWILTDVQNFQIEQEIIGTMFFQKTAF